MPHPIYGPPSHELERVVITVVLPSPQNGHVTSIRALGETSTQRSSLWSESATWTADEVAHGLQPTDWATHVLLTALQDRPKDQAALDTGLTGGGFEDVPLPF